MPEKPRKMFQALEMTQDSVISHMRSLRANDSVEVLQGLWALEREKIIAEGKKLRQGDAWAMLDGFDRASSAIVRWAAKDTLAEKADRTRDQEEVPS